MCGCNNNVKFIKENNAPVVEYNVPAPKRKLTTFCDVIGQCGLVQKDEFTTSCGNLLISERQNQNKANFPAGCFSVSMSASYVTSIGLRQVAEELAMLADQIDGQKTQLVMNQPTMIVKKRKKAKKVRSSKK